MTGLSGKDQIATQIYRNFFLNWLSNYAIREKSLPDTIIIYREGLSDIQIKKTLNEEIDTLHQILTCIRKSETNGDKYKNYNPEIAVFTVNKKINSKFYDFDQKNKDRCSNPTTGSVIFCEMANTIQTSLLQIVNSKLGEYSQI
jgi:hypothetical protein